MESGHLHEPTDQIRWEEAPRDFLGAIPGIGRVRAALTERSGGVSVGPFQSLNLGRSTADTQENVRVNESRALASQGLPDHVARLRLEHGARILTLREPGLHGPADAIVSDRHDLVLWLTVADCYPVAMAAGEWRGLGHCGWRGVAEGLPSKLARELARVVGAPVRAWIGPGIGACCYEVGPEVARAFPASALQPSAADRSRLDLRAEIGRQLLEAGLGQDDIAHSAACTACSPERFFSHRRDGVPSGRMAALVWVEP